MSGVRPMFLEKFKSWVGMGAEAPPKRPLDISESEESESDCESDCESPESYESFPSTCESCDYQFPAENESKASNDRKRRRLSDEDSKARDLETKYKNLEYENASLRAMKCNLIRENTVLDTQLREATYQYNAQRREAEYNRVRGQAIQDVMVNQREFARADFEARDIKRSQEAELKLAALNEQVEHLKNIHTLLASATSEPTPTKVEDSSLSAHYRKAHLRFVEDMAVKEQELAAADTHNRVLADQLHALSGHYNTSQLMIDELQSELSKLKTLSGDVQGLAETRGALQLEIEDLKKEIQEYESLACDEVSGSSKAAGQLESQRSELLQKLRQDPGIFRTTSVSARDDFELCLAAIEEDWRNLAYCSLAMRSNPRVVKAALEQNPRAFTLTSRDYQHTFKNALDLVLMDHTAFRVLPSKLQYSRKFRELVASCAPRALFPDNVNAGQQSPSISDKEEAEEEEEEEEESEIDEDDISPLVESDVDTE